MGDIRSASRASVDDDADDDEDGRNEDTTDQDFEDKTAVDLRELTGLFDRTVGGGNVLQVFKIIHEYIIAWEKENLSIDFL